MSHLSDAILRRYIDEPDALLSFEKEHLLQCAACRNRLTRYREHAAVAAAALPGAAQIDMEAARRGILSRASDARNATPPARSFGVPRRALQWSTALAAAVALVLAIGYTPLRGYAQSFLTIFEPQTFTPIGMSASDVSQLQALPDLEAFGSMHRSATEKPQTFSDLGDASRFAKQTILHPTYFPADVPHTTSYQVTNKETVSFTFDAAKVRAAAAAKGVTPPAMPANIDGSTLTATVEPIVVQLYGQPPKGARKGKRARGLPRNMLMVTQAPVPHVYSTGATVAQIEAYLLEQPSLPAGLAAQIRAIGDPATTVPVPIRLDRQNAKNVSVNGAPALLIGDNTGVGSLIMWQQNGMIHAVAGPYTADQILAVANSLAP